jgi:hypothetical protein
VKTRNGLPKHCTPQRDASGKVRIRFRTPTFSTYFPANLIPWSEPFMRAYAAASPTTAVLRTPPRRHVANIRRASGGYIFEN